MIPEMHHLIHMMKLFGVHYRAGYMDSPMGRGLFFAANHHVGFLPISYDMYRLGATQREHLSCGMVVLQYMYAHQVFILDNCDFPVGKSHLRLIINDEWYVMKDTGTCLTLEGKLAKLGPVKGIAAWKDLPQMGRDWLHRACDLYDQSCHKYDRHD